jgi:DNA-binding GntR family transcriptional regulator
MPSADAKAAPREGRNVSIVHDQLRSEILTGNIPSGETSQADLARRLDVGRTPLREAIRMLQREGLVISEPNRRVRITDLGPAGIAELEGLLAQMDFYRRTEDFAGFRVPHRAFHEKLVSGAGERMMTLAMQLFDHGERYRVKFGSTTSKVWAERRAEHRAILDSVAEGDADATVRTVVAHYARTAVLVFSGLGEDYDPRRLRVAVAAATADPEFAAEIL